MKWINIDTATLDAPEFVGATPTQRSTWLCLLRYCVGQENGGRITAAATWTDRKWQQLARVTHREVNTPTELWTWHNDDITLWNYPTDKEAEVRRNRENGKRGGRPAQQPHDPAHPPATETHDQTTRLTTTPAPAKTERKRKEKGTEQEEEKTLLPLETLYPPALDTPEFRTAWQDWNAYRRERHLAHLQKRATAAQLEKLAEWGHAAALASIRNSIRNNWQGLFEPKHDPRQTPHPAKPSEYSNAF